MRLRARLLVTIALCAIPLAAGVIWVKLDLDRRAVEEAMNHFIRERMTTGGRLECEADPERFPGRSPRPPSPPESVRGGARPLRAPDGSPAPPPPGPVPLPPRPPVGSAHAPPPPFEYWAYRTSLVSENPSAPQFPPSLAAELAGGAAVAGGAYSTPDGEGWQLAVRMSWDTGPAAVMLVRQAGSPTSTAQMEMIWSASALVFGLLLAVLLAAGPIVQRIRLLTEAVRRSAATGYREPITATGHDEIADLARAFNDAGREVQEHLAGLEQRERALRTFVANTTHDVAIPLTVLQGHLVALERELADADDTARQALRRAVEETHYMGALIHNLATAAKLEAGEPDFDRRPVDLGSLVERVVARHRPLAAARGVAIEHAVPAEVLNATGDVTLLEQAASNVVHNAIRYNTEGGHVAITLELVRGEPPRFRLLVVDDGPGVSEEQLAHLTERDFRTDEARSRRPEGMGLGLAIVRDVASRHEMPLSITRSDYGGLQVELAGVCCEDGVG